MSARNAAIHGQAPVPSVVDNWRPACGEIFLTAHIAGESWFPTGMGLQLRRFLSRHFAENRIWKASGKRASILAGAIL